MSLAATQQRMHEALVFPRRGVAEDLLIDSGRLAARRGLEVYQRGYFLRIAACMRGQFPALCHALGQALFDDFVADYIRDCPPASHTLYDLGARFAGWMAANRPDAAAREEWIDFMIDLARFEYAVFAMFDAEGNEGRPFAAQDTPDAALRLQPAFALGSYGFPVAEYYHGVRRGEDPALPAAAPSHVALVRSDYVTRTIPLSAAHHCFLAAMAEGSDVDAAIEAVAAFVDAPLDQVRESWRAEQGSRSRWIGWGFFTIRIDKV